MIKIGMMIGDRYEILEKIGTGGMSDVYKAKCHKLNRLVAVKVLKQEFSENANFVSKFRTEAQSAAGLMHPNIVNVYDVGDENGIYYIVMELVEGMTLKKYIEKKARLSVKESLTIAMQICLGIEAAHNNHIIHRDIKPQNVILSKDGKVKVTDFGIAKAATSNTITSNVMGSVHYTSPEQARGGYSDEKSDIYSLGITLFEMLTGRVPFNGETTVAIAIKQIQEEMPSPREFVPEIPVSVEQIVLKCTQKSPDRRYQSMGELIEDLKLSFSNPDENFVKIITDDEYAQTRTMTDDELTSVKKNAKNFDDFTGELPKAPNKEEEEDEYDSRMAKTTTILAIIMGAIICVVAILLIGKAIGVFRLSKDNTSVSTPSSHTSASSAQTSGEPSIKVDKIDMPEVYLMTFEAASALLEKNGLYAKAVYEESDSVAEGIVMDSDPKAGLKVEVGSVVELKVSSGASSEIVPDVVGKQLSAANKAIMAKDFKVEIVEQFSNTVDVNVVISQVPEGNAKAPLNSTVTIYVSKGPELSYTTVPKVEGLSREDAIITLTEWGLTAGSTKEVYDDFYKEGLVSYQSIPFGDSVVTGTVVDLLISKGPEPKVNVVETYSFNGEILAPSTAEDPDFVSGTSVQITITTKSGTELFDTVTTAFPTRVKLNSIPSESEGIITLTYSVTLPATSVSDPDTGGTTVTPGKTEERKIVREVTFAKDGE